MRYSILDLNSSIITGASAHPVPIWGKVAIGIAKSFARKGKKGGGGKKSGGGSEHKKNKRPSTKGKHEKGQARRDADQKRKQERENKKKG